MCQTVFLAVAPYTHDLVYQDGYLYFAESMTVALPDDVVVRYSVMKGLAFDQDTPLVVSFTNSMGAVEPPGREKKCILYVIQEKVS